MLRGADSAEVTHGLDSRVIHSLFGSRDNEEGIKSLFEKRLPCHDSKGQCWMMRPKLIHGEIQLMPKRSSSSWNRRKGEVVLRRL